MLQGSVEETKGKGKAQVEWTLVGVRIGVVQRLPPPHTGKARGSKGGTVASTYGLCHHVYMCPNLTLLVLCFPGQGRTKSEGKLPGVCQSLLEFCRTCRDC